MAEVIFKRHKWCSMKYLVIDAELNGTGIRDKYKGEYLSPEDLGLNMDTIKRLNQWLLNYENEHYNEFLNQDMVDNLDREGREIASMIKKEITNVKMEYFSEARMINEIIE